MSGPTQLPPFGVLATALRRTTERLAREVARPSGSPPDWTELEWAVARAVAAIHGISVLLSNRLRWSGPPSWSGFLAEQREQSMLRDARIGRLLERVDAATRARNVGCIALKGAALRGFALYGCGERPMGDVDLLATPTAVPLVASALADLGYAEAYQTQRHRVYASERNAPASRLGEHADNPLKIEVHQAVAEHLPVRSVDITRCLLRGPIGHGINPYPNTSALLLHLLLHAAGNMRSHTLRQIQLNDIATVAALLRDEDWHALLGGRRAEERRWWAFPPLALTARYYPDAVPAAVLQAARVRCPRWLRSATGNLSLTHVSLSNLRIHAFPGIAWSRTAPEALQFIRSRVLPSRRALAEIDAALTAEPQLHTVPWYGQSHGRRIWRWLVSRPPRVQTLVSVCAAQERTAATPRG